MDSLDAPDKANSGIKRKIVEDSVMAVVQGLINLNFAYSQDGMVDFAESIVSAGQSVPPNTDVDIPYLLTSPPTVRNGVTKLAKRLRVDLMDALPRIMRIGGGMTCDGLKLDSNGRKYFDFIVHYNAVTDRETI